MQLTRYRSYVLPAALLLGVIFHRFCGAAAVASPYIIFTILLLTFCAVDLRKLRPSWMDFWLLLVQFVLGIGGYLFVMSISHNQIIAEGILVGIICPVAAAVAVISTILGADRQRVTTFTIIGNLATAAAAPVIFSFVGVHREIPFLISFWTIFKRIGTMIALPFFTALLLQILLPRVNDRIAGFKGAAFYLWATVLFISLGQTIDFIFLHGKGNLGSILILAASSVVLCVVQFFTGRAIGKHFGDKIAGGQLLFQKNTAVGIWMANTYLHPLASVYCACYSICQNIVNAIQMWIHDRKSS